MADYSIYSVAIVIVFVVLTGPALVAAHDSAESDIQVLNEQQTVDTSSPVAVDQAASLYAPEVTVTTASGDVLKDGSDYEWNNRDGELTFKGASVSDGDPVYVDYRYTGYTQATSNVWEIISLLYSGLGVFIIAIVAKSIWQYVASNDYPMPGAGGGR